MEKMDIKFGIIVMATNSILTADLSMATKAFRRLANCLRLLLSHTRDPRPNIVLAPIVQPEIFII